MFSFEVRLYVASSEHFFTNISALEWKKKQESWLLCFFFLEHNTTFSSQSVAISLLYPIWSFPLWHKMSQTETFLWSHQNCGAEQMVEEIHPLLEWWSQSRDWEFDVHFYTDKLYWPEAQCFVPHIDDVVDCMSGCCLSNGLDATAQTILALHKRDKET